MITLRDRYFYVNLTNPVYNVVQGLVPLYEIGPIMPDGVDALIASGGELVDWGMTIVSKTDLLELGTWNDGATPKYVAYVPTTIGDGQDQYAEIACQYRKTIGGDIEEVRASIRIFPLANFYVSCPEQPDGVDVWAIDLDSECGSEAINGNAIDTSVTDILFTSPGERPRRNAYGSPLPRAVWTNIDSHMAETLLDRTIESLARWENRIFIDRARATMQIDRKKHMVTLTIPYAVIESRKSFLYRKRFATQ